MNRNLFNQRGGTGILPVRGNRRGFTLVEMLVVVLIIAILAGLISAAAIRARNRAKIAAIAVEIKQLSMALEQYKNDLGGEYPPDFSDVTSDYGKSLILRHISRAFPRFVLNGATTSDKWNDLKTNYIHNINSMDPSKALLAWLGGIQDAQGRPSGFSKNPLNPFESPTVQPSRIGPFYDFDPGRIQNDSYYASGINPGSGYPYIYLRAEQGQTESNREYYYYDPTITPNPYKFKKGPDSHAMPYWDQRSKGWVNPKSFQILCCGLDGKFGKENVYLTGQVTGAGLPTPPPDLTADVIGTDSPSFPPGNFDHLDDQTNFTSGTIGDDLP